MRRRSRFLRFILILLMIILVVVLVMYACDRFRVPEAPAPRQPRFDQVGDTAMAARTADRYFQIYRGREWDTIFVQGVNLGTSLPGGWFTEFPADRELYRKWLEQMHSLNLNTIRLYTLLDPAFYQVFREFNQETDQPRIWLIQEIWPHDQVPGIDYVDERCPDVPYDRVYEDGSGLGFFEPAYVNDYIQEIHTVVDALHGNAEIPGRPGRAYGVYSADVSPYVLGVLVGREFIPEEVEVTNRANPSRRVHDGRYVAAYDADPTEVWLAWMTDEILAYSQETYGWQYPVGFVSWPTLDPLDQPTEWDAPGVSAQPAYNDREEIHPDRFRIGPDNKAGFFGAYHIYPNYPDFMNNEPRYDDYTDAQGRFRYRGYLHEFMQIHPRYPALVGEYGISTSLNTAHLNPDGLHHGGLSEEDQGTMIIRMTESIRQEGYAGAVIFEWADEWAKKTWLTEPYMVPWDRQVLWQNAMDPEQNYGLLAVEPARLPFTGAQVALDGISDESLQPGGTRRGMVTSMEADANERFLYLRIGLAEMAGRTSEEDFWRDLDLAVGIDTGVRESGARRIPVPGTPDLPSGAEFLLRVRGPDDAALLAVPSYNRGNYRYRAVSYPDAVFERIVVVVNRARILEDGRVFPELTDDQSVLRNGHFDPEHPEYYSLAHWYTDLEGGRLVVRLPWMLLGIADPSSYLLLYDDGEHFEDPCRDGLKTVPGEGFLFYAATWRSEEEATVLLDYQPRWGGSFGQHTPYEWPTWEEPQYRTRLKKSAPALAEYFGRDR